MSSMNEYQIRNLKKYEESHERLSLIVKELNTLDLGDVGHFEIRPVDADIDYSQPGNVTPRCLFITAKFPEGTLEIMCERDGYGFRDRWEFIPTGWPKYTNENGETETIDPSNLWDPKEFRPTSTAAQDRAAKAIARQIANKIIGEYIRIYHRCLDKAQSHEEHARKAQDARERLADACHDDREFRGRPQRIFYIRNYPGTQRVEYRSEGDVKMNLTTDEAIAVIAMLRKMYS